MTICKGFQDVLCRYDCVICAVFPLVEKAAAGELNCCWDVQGEPAAAAAAAAAAAVGKRRTAVEKRLGLKVAV
jgi:hypothetical protein